MESKKISFGFSKSKKKTTLLPRQSETTEKVEYISSFDKDTKVLTEKEELIIPVKTDYSVAERITLKKRKEAEIVTEHDGVSGTDGKNVSLETLAIQELLRDPKKTEDSGSNLTIPITVDSSDITGIDADYDNVPVQDFGYAMLRGMGWAPGKGIGKKQKLIEVKIPELRARGLGLGANTTASVDQ